MEKWKTVFEEENYIQIEDNKFYNKDKDETVIFKNGLVFVRSQNEDRPIPQNILSACASFVEDNSSVKTKRKLVGFILENGTFFIYERFNIPSIYRIGKAKKMLRKPISKVVFFEDGDLVYITDINGRMHVLKEKDIAVEEEIKLKDLFPKLKLPITFIGKMDKEDKKKEYFVIITKGNKIKKTPMEEYSFNSSLLSIDLRKGDKIIYACAANDEEKIILLGEDSKLLKSNLSEYPSVGRISRGYKGFYNQKDVHSALVASNESLILTGGNYKGKLNKVSQVKYGGRSTSGRVISDDAEYLISVTEDILIIDNSNKIALLNKKHIPFKPIKSKGVKLLQTDIKLIFG